jgi:hypothetical protein
MPFQLRLCRLSHLRSTRRQRSQGLPVDALRGVPMVCLGERRHTDPKMSPSEVGNVLSGLRGGRQISLGALATWRAKAEACRLLWRTSCSMGQVNARVHRATSFSFCRRSAVKRVPSSLTSSDSGCSSTSQDRWPFLKEPGVQLLGVDRSPLSLPCLARAQLSLGPAFSAGVGSGQTLSIPAMG